MSVDAEDLDDLEPLDEIDIVIEEDEGDFDIAELIVSAEIPPIIRIVNAIISEAIRYRASDIHIEPKTKYTLIRYRVDGPADDQPWLPRKRTAAGGKKRGDAHAC